jgi:hypothetical protein
LVSIGQRVHSSASELNFPLSALEIKGAPFDSSRTDIPLQTFAKRARYFL